jgi:hypothetical protein
MDELVTRKKCLEITGSFEGAGWGGASGNFDGAGLSLGILQFCALAGKAQELLTSMYQADPKVFQSIAKEKADAIVKFAICGNRDDEQSFISDITTGAQFPVKEGSNHFAGGKLLKPDWKDTLQQLCEHFQDQQVALAGHYFDDAIKECQFFRLNTERSIAFMFDLCVQRGRGNLNNEQKAFLKIVKLPDYVEDDDTWLKFILESDTKDTSDTWKKDVYSRRACILNDGGVVHGREYDLGGEFGLTDKKVL